MAKWLTGQWVTNLGPYLTGPAQVVLKTMTSQEASDYQKVKTDILDHYEVTEETQRQCFRMLC